MSVLLLSNNILNLYPMEHNSHTNYQQTDAIASAVSQPPTLISLALQKLPLDALIWLEKIRKLCLFRAEINTFDYMKNIVLLLQKEGIARLITHSDSSNSLFTTVDQKIVHALIHTNPVTKFILQAQKDIRTVKEFDNTITALSKSPYDNYLAIALISGQVFLWNTQTNKCITSYQVPTLWVNTIAWSSDGRCACATAEGTIHIQEIKKNTAPTLLLNNAEIKALDWQHHILVGGADEGTLYIWNTDNYECIKTVQGHTKRVTSVLVDADTNQLISTANDGTLRLWNLNTYECVEEAQTENSLTCAALHNTHHIVAVGTSEGTIHVWNLKSKEHLICLTGHTRRINSIVILDKQHLISSSDDGSVRLWNSLKGTSIDLWQGPLNIAASLIVRLQNDGRLFCAYAQNNFVHSVHINIPIIRNLSLKQAVLLEVFKHADALKKIKKHDHLQDIFHSLPGSLKKILDPHTRISPFMVARRISWLLHPKIQSR